jgi:flagellar biosynthesis protein FlhA
VVRQHADEILSRDATRHLVDELKKTSPAVVDELIPQQMKLADVQQVLQTLLREQVPIRQLGLILETLGQHASTTRDPTVLAEHVRRRLARSLSMRYRDEDNRLVVVTLEAELEQQVRECLESSDNGLAVRVSPRAVDAVCRSIEQELARVKEDEIAASDRPPIVLVSPDIRAGFKQITTARLPRLVVLSYDEISADTRVESAGMASVNSELVARS